MRNIAFGALFIVGAALAAACGGGGDAPDDVGDACADIGEAWCSRATACEVVADELGCVNDFMRACCIDSGACGEPADVGADEWNECLDDVDDMTCPVVASGDLPVSCLRL